MLRGIGDDAAVVRSRPLCVTSVDAMIEGTHFRLGETGDTPADVGWRALAGALSDLAAMGAEAGEAYLALGLPPGFSEQAALELVRGAIELARETGTAIAGGDVVAAPVLVASVTAVGWAEQDDPLPGRDGALEGDLVGVTGTLGAAAAALALALAEQGAARAPGAAELLERARRPRPRLREGRALAGAGVHAMIDISDGLAADAAHVGRASGACLRVRLAALPLAPSLEQLCEAAGLSPRELAAQGGEDYELCFCAAPADRARVERALGELGGVEVTWVGEVVAGAGGAVFSDDGGDDVRIEGFEHRW